MCALSKTVVLICLSVFAAGLQATTLNVQYQDAAGEGFNSLSPVSPIEGNSGVTLGERRKIAFEHATKLFERAIWMPSTSAFPIEVEFGDARGFEALAYVISEFPISAYTPGIVDGRELGYSYPQMLVALLSPSADKTNHVGEIIFSSESDNFDFSIDRANRNSLVAISLHEFVHLAGFTGSSILSTNQVSPPDVSRVDIYDKFMFHNGATPRAFEDMTLEQRDAFLDARDDARFIGPSTQAAAPTLLTAGQENGEVFLNAVAANGGSDISHLSPTVAPHSLMHSDGADTFELGIAAHMLSDLGWGPVVDSKIEVRTDSSGANVLLEADAAITDLVVNIQIPDDLTATNLNASPATCSTSGQSITCSYGSLAANDEQVIAFDLVGSGDGSYSVTADVDHQAAHVDPKPANNFAAANFVVGANPLSAIALNNSSVNEDVSVGTAVGTLSTSSTDTDLSYSYLFVEGEGDTHNNLFLLSGNTVNTATEFDVSSDEIKTVRVRSIANNGFTFEQSLAITIAAINPITGLTLSSNSVSANSSTNTRVGTLSTRSSDSSLGYSYSLVAGAGDSNNSAYSIVGNALNTATTTSNATTHSVRIRTTATNGFTFEDTFSISVTAAAAPTQPSDPCLASASFLPMNSAFADDGNQVGKPFWLAQLALIAGLLLLFKAVQASTLNKYLKYVLLGFLGLGLAACGGGGGGSGGC